jgi:phage terminase large subunit-like protein
MRSDRPGVDGGGLDDLYGLTLIGREKITKNWLTWSHAWCHRGVLERRKSIAPALSSSTVR